MKKRWKKIAIWVGSIIVVILIAGYFAINFAANKVLDSLADSALEDALNSQPAVGDSVVPAGGDAGAGGTAPASPSASASASPSNSADAGAEASADGGSAASGGESSGSAGSGQAAAGDKGGSTGGEAAKPSPSASAAGGSSGEISVDQAQQVKDEISFSEKTKVMTVMLKRLSPSDIKTLSSLAGGGLSVQEKKEAKELILQKLSEKEYDDLIAIAKKYGLSQGKSYADSKKEK